MGWVQFVVFQKFTSAILHQIAQEGMLLLHNLHAKHITQSQVEILAAYMGYL